MKNKNAKTKDTGWSEPVAADIANPQSETSCKDRTGRFVRVPEEMRLNYTEKMAELKAFHQAHGPQPIAKFTSLEKKSKSGVVLTPELAMDSLKAVRYNRMIIEKNLQDYSMLVLNGQWIPDHSESTRWDTEGYYVDGSHRAHVVLLTGVPIIVRVDMGLSQDEVETLNSRKAARSANSLSGYQFDAPLGTEVIHGVKTLLRTLGLSNDTEGIDTPYKRFVNTYSDLIKKIIPHLPKKSKDMPNYFKGEVIAALLMIGVFDGEVLDGWLPWFNQHVRFKTCELTDNRVYLFGWFDKYVEGRAVEMDRSPTDYLMRCKAFLSAFINEKKPMNGANGLTNLDFTDELARKLLDGAELDVQLSDADREPTIWRNDPNYVRERKK